MINKVNVKYAIDLVASVAVIGACALVIWVGVSTRIASKEAASAARPSSPPVENIAAKHLDLSIGDAPTLGKLTSPITLIEFSDFECPFCRRFVEETFDELRKQFIEAGSISYSYVHHPLTRIHKSALAAARVAKCASDQGQFWELHAGLFRVAASPGLDHDSITALVDQTQLDQSRLEKCLMTVEERLQRELAEAARIGVRSTPTFFLGIKSSDGRISLRSRINGAQPFDVFASAINNLARQVSKGGS